MRTLLDKAEDGSHPTDSGGGLTGYLYRDTSPAKAMPPAADFHQSLDRFGWFRRNSVDARMALVSRRDQVVCSAMFEKTGDRWFLWKGPAGEAVPGALEALLGVCEELRPVTLVLAPEWANTDVLKNMGFSAAPPFCTLLTPTCGTDEDILGRMKASTRRGVMRARRSGMRFVEVPRGIERFYPVYAASMRSADSPDFATFRELTSLLEVRGVHLFLATIGEEVAAGSICFENADSLEARYVATHPRYRNLSPLHLVHFSTIQYAVRLGRSYFDLSGIATGQLTDKLAGINRFKEGFGGHRYEYPVFVRESTGQSPVERQLAPTDRAQ